MSVRYTTISAMRAAATSGFSTNVENTCYVDALADFFKFVPGSTTPDVSNIVVSSSDALGKWHRMGIPPQVAAGAVLLYDASGNATAYAASTAGQVLTSNGAGLQPTWGDCAPILIDSQTLTNAANYTSPTWTANTYRRLRGVLRLSSWTHAQVRFAGIAANTGRTAGTRIAATAFSDATAMWLNYGASTPEIGIITFDLYPVKDTAPRGGSSRTSSVDVATGLVTDMCNFNFQSTDLTTDITGILIDFLTTNATGTLRLYGEKQ